MVRVAVLGATGYAGAELLRLLAGHPAVQVTMVTSQQYVGRGIAEVYPHLRGTLDLTLSAQDAGAAAAAADIIFLALPHGHAGEVARVALAAGKRVIDLGADFRFRETDTYTAWYRLAHPAPELQPQAAYGLPELHRAEVAGAGLVANPGCYPTAGILALAPALAEGLLEPESIIIDAKSGVSGAGRGLSLGNLYGEVNEGVHPYGVAGHRHTPEIEQELSRLAGQALAISFTPHLIPMTRGILATAYGRLTRPLETQEVREIYARFYDGEPFVHLLPEGQWPHTKWVYGSNRCQLNLTVDRRTGRLIVASAIDNLVKGAAGQAVQNLNIWLGLPETTALAGAAIYP